MANWAHGGRTLFKSGAWAGFLSLEGKKRDVILKLTFNSGEGTFNGIGNDPSLGRLKIEGTVTLQPPYSCEGIISCAAVGGALSFTGWREAGEGGFFGEWKGEGIEGQGRFGFSPVVDVSKATTIMAQLAEPDDRLSTLKAMGYSNELCMRAIQVSGCSNLPLNLEETHSLEEAVEWISLQGNSHDEPVPAAVLGDDSFTLTEPSQENIQQIVELGFSVEEAKNALAIAGNNVAKAAEILLG